MMSETIFTRKAAYDKDTKRMSEAQDDAVTPAPRYVITLTAEEWETLADRSKHLVLNLNYLGRQIDVLLQRQHGEDCASCKCDELVDCQNKWGQLASLFDLTADCSGGAMRDAIARLKIRRFRVTDGGEREGCCYSFYDHCELHWDDGEHELWRAELSTDGTRKVEVNDE